MRQIVQVTLARFSKLTLYEIGLHTGKRDHATVINSKRNIENAEYQFKTHGVKYDILTEYLVFEHRFRQCVNPVRCS